MKVIISGSSGFVGTLLVSFLKDLGHEVIPIVRNQRKYDDKENCVFWDPSSGNIDSSSLEGADVVINLSGENIHSVWTNAKKTQYT